MKLRPNEKMIVQLYSEGLNYKEIAAKTGWSYHGIMEMIARIRRRHGIRHSGEMVAICLREKLIA